MKAALIPLALLGACTTGYDVAGVPTGPCRIDEQVRMRFVGTGFQTVLRDDLRYATNSRIARVVRPDDAATAEVQTDRLNILLDDEDRIDGLRCG